MLIPFQSSNTYWVHMTDGGTAFSILISLTRSVRNCVDMSRGNARNQQLEANPNVPPGFSVTLARARGMKMYPRTCTGERSRYCTLSQIHEQYLTFDRN